MRAIFILISNPLFRLSRPSRFVLPFWFSHCFLLNRHKNPIYTRLFLRAGSFFYAFWISKRLKQLKKVRNFNLFCRTDTKLHKSYSFLTQKNTNFLVEMCVFLRYNSTITKNTEEDITMSEYRVITADGNAQFRHTTAEFFPNGQRNYPR